MRDDSAYGCDSELLIVDLEARLRFDPLLGVLRVFGASELLAVVE